MIAAALSFVVALQVTTELRQHVDAGLKAKAAGDLDAALREFQRVTELAPDLAAAHVNLGAVYFARKDYGEAARSLGRALQLNPDLPGAAGMLGAALLAQGYAAESIPHLEKAEANDLLGVALLESGRVSEAIERLQAAFQKRPNDEDVLYYLGRAHGLRSRQLLERLQESSPDSARTQQVLGETMAASGNREGAEKRFRAALALRPDLRGVHAILGEIFLESGEYENAEREFRAEAQMVPGSALAAYRLGQVLLNRGQIQEAIAELRRSDKLQPETPETLLELGKGLTIAGELADAEKLLRKVLDAEKTSRLAESAHFQLAELYRRLGRSADADREISLFKELRAKRK